MSTSQNFITRVARRLALTVKLRMLVRAIEDHDDDIVNHEREAAAAAIRRDALELKLGDVRLLLARERV